MTPNKDESKADFLKRAAEGGVSPEDAAAAWDKAQAPKEFEGPKEDEDEAPFLKRFMEHPAHAATYPDEAGRRAAALVKFAAAQKFGEILGVEIFSTGTWSGSKKITVTQAMLDEMVFAWKNLNDKVSGYRPPLKLGHDDAQKFIRQHNGSGAPALGWVHNLRRVGNKIVADFKNVPSALLDLIREKRYNSVSIELLPSLEYAGKSFATVLTAVAILGAELPAVKGLQDLSTTLGFAGAPDPVTLSQKEEDTTMVTYTQEQHDALVAAAVGKAKTEFDAANAANTTKLTGDLRVATERAEQSEAALKQFKIEAERAEINAFLDAAIKDGKVMPVEKDGLVAVATSMAQGAKVKLGDKEQSGLDAFKEMIGKRPVAVNFKSITQGRGDRQDGEQASVTVTNRAREKQGKAGGEDKLSFKTAVDAVLAEDPALKQRYFQEI